MTDECVDRAPVELTDVVKNPESNTKRLARTTLVMFVHKVQSYGFWVLVITGLGIFLGLKYATYELVEKLDVATKTGNFYYRGTVYDLKKRDIQPAPDDIQVSASTKLVGGSIGSTTGTAKKSSIK